MSLAYTPPGVTVQELTSPSITPLLAIPGSICLVGLSSGVLQRTDLVTLTGTTATLLPNLPRDQSGNLLATLTANVTTTVNGANQTLSTSPSTLTVTSTTGFPTNGVAEVAISTGTSVFVTYTGSTGTTLTGCTVPIGSFTAQSAGLVAYTPAIVNIFDAVNPGNAPSGYTASTDYSLNAGTGSLTRLVTTNTNTGAITAAATTFTLTSGSPAPAVGQVIRLTDTGVNPLTETATVLSVVGTTVTLTAPLINAYHTVSTISWGNIPDGNQVFVTYLYTPNDYFQPIRLTSMADIQDRFGTAWDPTNTTINSPLSFAAGLAFQNGASNIVLQPLYGLSNGLRVQATATNNADPTIWANVFNGLLDLEDINIVVPIVGQSQTNVTDSVVRQIEQATQDLVFQMINAEDRYLIGIVGEDSSASSSVAQQATLQAHAQTLIARYNRVVTEQLVFINTSKFSVPNAVGTFFVGGQYAAAAVAGMLAARNPADTLTRQVVAGIAAVADLRTTSAKNSDAATGMFVLESKGQIVQVRHSITLDNTSSATRELNVVRAKHFIIESVRQTLDTQIIGRVVADANAPTTVNSVVIGTLEDLRALGALTIYENVESRITTLDPTAMEVRFDYAPSFVINYINIGFSLDLTANSILVTSNGSTS